MLNDEGFSATRYHAGLDVEERAQNQDDFIYDRKRIMVATNAFGMGIDKGNVSFVLHYNMPKDMESYYQEAGRAGRDGNKAECILLFGEGDIATNKYLIEHANSEDDNIDNQYKLLYKMVDYCKTDNCLRAYILGYFGESYNGNCGNCGNCNSVNSEKVDCTKQAEVIVNCIKNLKRAYGISVIVSILKGGKDKNIVQGKLYNTPEYASMNTYSREEISAIIERMLDLKILERTGTVYPVIKVCDEFLNCDNLPSVFVSKNKIVGKKGKVQTTKTNTYVVSAEDEDVRNLLVILKGVRLEIAKRESMPAYIVFSDATLADMSKKMPINKDEFLSVSGVGEIKCNRYGDEFMQAIKTYLGIL
jgi:ATP-dependent DNA helicase RecQ